MGTRSNKWPRRTLLCKYVLHLLLERTRFVCGAAAFSNQLWVSLQPQPWTQTTSLSQLLCWQVFSHVTTCRYEMCRLIGRYSYIMQNVQFCQLLNQSTTNHCFVLHINNFNMKNGANARKEMWFKHICKVDCYLFCYPVLLSFRRLTSLTRECPVNKSVTIYSKKMKLTQ